MVNELSARYEAEAQTASQVHLAEVARWREETREVEARLRVEISDAEKKN